MSPLPYFAMRADTTPTSTEDPTPTHRIYIQQDTNVPTPSERPTNRGMPITTKVGLAMVPVVIIMVALLIVFLFWYRKRRAARRQNIRGSISPPALAKDLMSCNSSVANKRGSSKVHRMAAFSVPVHDGPQREAELLGLGGALEVAVRNNKNKMFQARVIVAPTKFPVLVEADLDSPIDGSSPFRLKRGDTVKRYSIGPELARLWPSPPASAWTRPLRTYQEPAYQLTNRDSSVYQERPFRSIR